MKVETADGNIVDVYRNRIEVAMDQFKTEFEIGDLSTVPLNVWNGCMIYVGKSVFSADKRADFRQRKASGKTIYNAYDKKKLLQMADYYSYLCLVHNHPISVSGFCYLLNMDPAQLYQWNQNPNDVEGRRLYEKLRRSREESLSNLLTGGKNPVGVLGILNREYAWNLPGVTRETTKRKELTNDEVGKFLGLGMSDLGDSADGGDDADDADDMPTLKLSMPEE